jgi:hypothetical protein
VPLAPADAAVERGAEPGPAAHENGLRDGGCGAWLAAGVVPAGAGAAPRQIDSSGGVAGKIDQFDEAVAHRVDVGGARNLAPVGTGDPDLVRSWRERINSAEPVDHHGDYGPEACPRGAPAAPSIEDVQDAIGAVGDDRAAVGRHREGGRPPRRRRSNSRRRPHRAQGEAMAGERQHAAGPRRRSGVKHEKVGPARRDRDRRHEASRLLAATAGTRRVDEGAGARIKPPQAAALDVEQPHHAIVRQRDVRRRDEAAEASRRVREARGPSKRVLERQRAIERRDRDPARGRRDRPAVTPVEQHPGRIVGRTRRRIAKARGAADHATDPRAVGSVNTLAVTD